MPPFRVKWCMGISRTCRPSATSRAASFLQNEDLPLPGPPLMTQREVWGGS